MFNCSGCWDSPCTCGLGYKDWSDAKLKDQIRMLRRVLFDDERKKRNVKNEAKT